MCMCLCESACVLYILKKRRTTSVYVQGKKQAFFLWFFSACKQTNKQSAIKIQKRLYNAFDFILFAVYMFFFACFFRLFSSFASPWNTFCLHSARSFRRRRCRCRRLFYVFYFFTFEFRVYFNNRLLGNWERQCADWSCFADLFFFRNKKFFVLILHTISICAL